MSSKTCAQKLSLGRGAGHNLINSKEWEFIGYFGTHFIFGRGDKRCFVDPKTGEVSFEYEMVMRDTG